MSVLVSYVRKPDGEENYTCSTECPYPVFFKDYGDWWTAWKHVDSGSRAYVGSNICTQYCKYHVSTKSNVIRCKYEELNHD